MIPELPSLCPENLDPTQSLSADQRPPVASSQEQEATPDSVADLCGPPTAKGELDPLLVTVPQAQKLLGIGKTSVFSLVNQGVLERRKLGGATRITMRSIRKVAGS